jgi:hypothetical protein
VTAKTSRLREGDDDPQHDAARLRKRAFVRDILDTQSWIAAADRLTAAMAVLEPGLEDWARRVRDSNGEVWTVEEGGLLVYMMLGGLAVENLCKGHLATVLTSKERTEIEQGQLPPRFNHKALSLFRLTGVAPYPGDENLLERVEQIVVWRGRYPVPKSSERRGPTWDSTSDTERIRVLIARLRAHLSASG